MLTTKMLFYMNQNQLYKILESNVWFVPEYIENQQQKMKLEIISYDFKVFSHIIIIYLFINWR